MQSKSKNPYWIHAKLEESYCKHQMYKCLIDSECEISIRPENGYVELDGGEEVVTKNIAIFIGNDMGTIETTLVLTKKEAREFANYILQMVNVLEKDNETEIKQNGN